ncbi:MAG: dTDP-glucose 4,6-dehydratase, partial [Elusimicrobia bacterium]|nr:dTDP-glucose 4,6-dehydratase [Elusimicrobiota bacterium]
HVDRSIDNAGPFMATNVIGTQVLLDAAKKYKVKRFLHVSTDEVYGDILKGKFTENSPFSPNSPYAVSKAAADMLVSAYHRTYGLPVVIMRASNNYGPWQFPEKLIPVIIKNALENKRVPVYAKGLNVREWLYVADCAKAVLAILEKGEDGQVYNAGSGIEKKNIDVVKGILARLGKPDKLIKFVKDRPGHDIRYALDISKTRNILGWKPETAFASGLKKTVDWYVENTKWTERVLAKESGGEK